MSPRGTSAGRLRDPSRRPEGLPTWEPEELEGSLVVLEGADGVGRSTQVSLLAPWIEASGFAVEVTGWTRSGLVSDLIERARAEAMVNPVTHSLLYATDFADRLQRTLLPALRAGKVVVSDRYVQTALARAEVRGIDRGWLEGVYGFAPDPDLTVRLTLDPRERLVRMLTRDRLDPWESGMDQGFGDDVYDSFVAYQEALTERFDRAAKRAGWAKVPADQPVAATQIQVRREVAEALGLEEASVYRSVEPEPPLDDAVWPAELTDEDLWRPPEDA